MTALQRIRRAVMQRTCGIGLHDWRHRFGLRHWHVECSICGAREIWRNHDTRQGYQPAIPDWTRPGSAAPANDP